MITEKDRIIALALVVAQGPNDEQIAANGWTPEQISYGNKCLRSMAEKIREGLHKFMPDEVVLGVLTREGFRG